VKATPSRWLGPLLALACTGNHEGLLRGQRYYEDNQYERALAVWRDLGRHETTLSPEERIRYTYLRGMTDYRLGFRSEARYWLGLAQAAETRRPGGVNPEWEARLAAALDDLNREAFGIVVDTTDPVQSIEIPSDTKSTESGGGEGSPGDAPIMSLPPTDPATPGRIE